jgi:NTP pyrophosphatase (non-canonical NTP hydrolase)
MREVEVGAIYRHFKGHTVKVLAIAKDTEDVSRSAVIYKHLGDGVVWYRPYDMFISEVDHEKYPEVTQKYRFERVEGSGSLSELNKETAKYYGYEAQSNQLVEECAELIQAVSKYRRATTGAGQPLADYKKTVALENLIEEIADVEVMLEQIKYLLQIPEDELEAMKVFKVTRTRERMVNN